MATSVFFFLFGAVALVLFLVFVVGLVVFVTRLARRTVWTNALRSRAVTEVAEDGFWIVSCGANPNATLFYYYWAGGVRHSGQASFQPGPNGRQFIYTGHRPERAVIARILDPAGGVPTDDWPPVVAAESIFPPGGVSDPGDSSGPSAAVSSFPSAY